MGEITEMMLDGTLCAGCGVYLGANTDYPVYCSSCRKEHRSISNEAKLAKGQQQKKTACPKCGRKVKAIGMKDHMRDAHGE